MRALLLPASMRLSFAAVLAFLLSFSMVVGEADAKAKAKKRKKKSVPTVTTVAPAKVAVGDVLIIKGTNFKAGTKVNTVVFRKASGGKFVFAPTLVSTTKRVTLKVPETIAAEMDVVAGVQQPTRFQVRVVSKRSSAFTAVGKSPTLLPKGGGSAVTDCDKDGAADNVDADDDNDGLSDAIESTYKMDPCNVDTDGDGMWDSYEFESALDLNYRSLPYPGKKPWPNPLDASDKEADFDGDGLKMHEEHRLWQAAGRPFPLNYSDGDQYTGGPVIAPVPDLNGLDIDKAEKGGPDDLRTGVGYLSDDEKDYDGDGIGNIHEFSFRMTQQYWEAMAAELGEKVYPLRPFNDLDPTDIDTDGDGVIDGLDDQDNDGWNNISELYRRPTAATNYLPYMVQPYNPCLPDWQSRACSRYVIAGSEPWSPFDLGKIYPGETMERLPFAPIGWDVSAGVPVDSPTPGYVPGS